MVSLAVVPLTLVVKTAPVVPALDTNCMPPVAAWALTVMLWPSTPVARDRPCDPVTLMVLGSAKFGPAPELASTTAL